MFLINKRKKYLLFGCLVFILSIMLSFFVSCNQNEDDLSYPSQKLLSRISADYRNHLIETRMIDETSSAQCKIVRCYGMYNGSVAVIIECSELLYPERVGSIEEIAGITLFDDPQRIEIWKNGDFYFLSNAYENKILSKRDVWEIAKKHNCYGKEWIAKKYADYVCANSTDNNAQEYTLDFYYGRYVYRANNTGNLHFVEAVMFNDITSKSPHVDNVAGVELFYQDGRTIKIMIDDGTNFLSLQDAYNQGCITAKDIEKIAKIHNSQTYFSNVES